MATLLLHFRIRCMNRFQGRFSRLVIQEHPGEILQIGFRDTDLATISQIHQKRQDLQAFIIQASDRLVCVGLLEGVEELLLERRLRTIHVSGECFIIRGEVIDGLLVGDNDRFLSFRRETVSDSIVIHPKNQPVVSPERDLHLIIDILYYVLLIERRGYFLVYRGLRHFQDFRVSAKYLTSL